MDVNTRRLRYFLAVAEIGHFGRAAATLHVSPAALSEQVRKLEEELGVRLLDRNPRGAELTTIGAEVAGRARAVLRETSGLAEAVNRHLRQQTGALRLVVTPVNSSGRVGGFRARVVAGAGKVDGCLRRSVR